MNNIKFDNFKMLSKTKQKKVIRHEVVADGCSLETAILTQRCHMRREYGNGNRGSEWYCDFAPVAHMEENKIYRKYCR